MFVLLFMKHDKSLHNFCAKMRCARRGTVHVPGTVINEDRIKEALDELGFAWDKLKSCEERIEELKAFKEKHGHVRVTVKHNKRSRLREHEICSSRKNRNGYQ